MRTRLPPARPARRQALHSVGPALLLGGLVAACAGKDDGDGGTGEDTGGADSGDEDDGDGPLNEYVGITRRAGPFVDVAAGQLFSCAVRDPAAGGEGLACWWQRREGIAAAGQVASAPLSGAWTQVAAGWWHACAVDEAGSLTCWGQDLAEPGETGRVHPEDGPWQSAAAGAVNTCALSGDGALACWQDPVFDQGQAEAPEGRFTAVAVGGDSACAVAEDGELACWGSDAHGQASPPSGSSWAEVGVGSAFACALDTDGGVACWGDDLDGQVSDAPSSGGFVSLAVGGRHACALDAAGEVSCWGADDYGQSSLAERALDQPVVIISAGVTHSCAVEAEGDAVCWGAGEPVPTQGDDLSHGSDVQPHWDASCVGCHGGVETGGVDLSPGRARTWLLEGTVEADLPSPVVRSAPEESYLLYKLRGTHEEVGGSGEAMPLTGMLRDDIVDEVERWIAQGAGA